jgi:hypothetical protein
MSGYENTHLMATNSSQCPATLIVGGLPVYLVIGFDIHL